WFDSRPPRPAGTAASGRQVLLWPDTFTDYFSPEVGQAAVEVLEHAGFEVLLPPDGLCCGLTWFTTGQLDTARRVLSRTLDAVDPYLSRGIPMVGLEPGCTSLFRSDAGELLSGDPRAHRAARSVLTFAELLDRHAPDADLGRLERAAVTQTHCHQHATLGKAADDRVMSRIGLDNERLDSGCCGLAGNFGFEKEHYGISVKIAENVLLPALRAAAPDTAVVADGFSCRTQISQLSSRRPVHLAELLRDSIRASAEAGPDA
ncbi:MAG TPA: heterodisulfide reductase-related iron-sulfur binding cluster, partial [Streptomyces sp.]